MVGQTHVVQALGNALTSGRLHHAYLFTGTRGIGKTTVSRILAKSLNCTGPDGTGGVTAHPCGECQACTEIDADRYIDYIELDAASNRGIDEIRDLIERAAYKPSAGRFKVFMIDEAHQLTKEAFNALLKTLEEPPDYLKFVLATTDPEKMLPTVLSRCLQFNLRPMAPETVQAHLQQVLEAEGVAADVGSLRLLSRAARGSMRDALSLTDQAIAFGAGALDEAGVRAMLGTVDRSHAAAVVQALARRDGASVLSTVNALRSHGLSAAGTLEEVATLLQQMAVEQAVPGALDDTDPDTAGARQLAAELAADETQLLYSIVVHGRAELSLMSDEYAALTMVLLRLLAFPAAGPLPAAAGASRAASLVATPHEARSTAPVRPGAVATAAVAVSASSAPIKPVDVINPKVVVPATPVAAAPLAAVPVTTAATAPAVAAVAAPVPCAATVAVPPSYRATPQQVLTAQEVPPWISEAVPDDVEPDARGSGEASETLFAAFEPDVAQSSAEKIKPSAAATALAATVPAAAPAVVVRTALRSATGPTLATALPPLTITALGSQWAAMIRPMVAAGTLAALVRELALQAELLAVEPLSEGSVSGLAADGTQANGRRWRLRVERETLRAAPLVAKLAAALQVATGEPVELDVVIGVPQDSIARRDTVAREAAQREADQTIQADASVLELMAQFPTARFVPGSIKPVAAQTAAVPR